MVDLIIKLLLVAGKNVILVVCNRLSKIAYFMTTIEGILAKGLAQLFRNNIWKLYKLLESIILDKRPQFAVDYNRKIN